MPKDVVFWICVIAAVFVLGALAIWKWGKNITLKAGPLSFGTSDRNAAASAPDPVTVGKKAAVEGSVGEIIGRTGTTATQASGPTDVAEQLKVGKGGRVDRIVGVEIGQAKKADQ